jgi:flagellar motor switch protein FliN
MSDDNNPDKMAAEWSAAMTEQGENVQDDIDALLAGNDKPAAPAAERAQLDEFAPAGRNQRNNSPDLDVILDIPVRISMEVGNTEITIRNLLQLNQGSVIELDRLAGEPLDVLVNGTLIAHGEVVVVNEKFGIRMTDVISPSERIKKLR